MKITDFNEKKILQFFNKQHKAWCKRRHSDVLFINTTLKSSASTWTFFPLAYFSQAWCLFTVAQERSRIKIRTKCRASSSGLPEASVRYSMVLIA